MDPKRIAAVKKQIEADSSENVQLTAKDFCELVTESRSEDEGLQKAAKAMAGHVGMLAINREMAGEMLGKISGKLSPEPKSQKRDTPPPA